MVRHFASYFAPRALDCVAGDSHIVLALRLSCCVYTEFDRLLEKHATETGLPVVVDFYSDSCGPCVSLSTRRALAVKIMISDISQQRWKLLLCYSA